MSAAFRSPAVFRIIGGKWRGRKIHFHSSSSLRSSGSRVRESLFNCLGQRLDNLNCLDLFAGGGALGLEAASRGAQTITFVEKNITTANAIRCTVNLLNAGNVQVRRADAFTFLSEAKEFFDVIFLDPPFSDYVDDKQWQHLLEKVAPRLNAGGTVYCESDRHIVPQAGWAVKTRKQAGAVCWQLLSQV